MFIFAPSVFISGQLIINYLDGRREQRLCLCSQCQIKNNVVKFHYIHFVE